MKIQVAAIDRINFQKQVFDENITKDLNVVTASFSKSRHIERYVKLYIYLAIRR